MKAILFLALQFIFISNLFCEINAIYNNDIVQISWNNPKNIEVDFFIIERSKNGSNFKEIIKVESSKIDNSLIEYYEIDSKPHREKGYYRVRQVDTEGRSFFTNVVVAKNPKKVTTLIRFLSKLKKGKITIKNDVLVVLLDAKRKEYVGKVNLIKDGEQYIITYSNIELPIGSYLVSATSSDEIYGKKLIIENNFSNSAYILSKE